MTPDLDRRMVTVAVPGTYRRLWPAVLQLAAICSAVLLASLLITSAVLRSALAQESSARVHLNEFMAAPEVGAPEYVEMIIGGTHPVAPDRLALRDATSAWRPLPTEPTALLPGDFVVVTPDTAQFRIWYQAAFPSHPPPPRLVELRPWPALNNGGDSLAVSLDGQQIEHLGYLSSQIERGRSLERRQTALPAHAWVNWSLPGSGVGSPGFKNSVSGVDATPPAVLGVELMDSTTLRIFFSEPLLEDDTRRIRASLSAEGPSGPVTLSGLTLEPDAFTAAHVQIPAPLSDLTLHLAGLRDPSGNEAEPSSHPVHVRPAPGELLITEVMLRGNSDFVEILADTERYLSLRDVVLTRSPGSLPEHITDTGSTAAHLVTPGRILVHEATLPATGVTLLLSVSGGAPSVIDSVRISSDMEDARFRQHTDRSFVRIGMGPTDWASSLSTPSSPGRDTAAASRHVVHAEPTPHALTLTEVLYDPVTDPGDGLADQVEFLEWTNSSPNPVSLFGAFMTWEINERGASDTLRLGYQPVLLAPGESVTAFRLASHQSGEDDPVRLLQQPWPHTPEGAITLPVRKALGLVNTGRTITLHARDHTVLAHGSYSPKDHHAAVTSGKGRSLVRLETGHGFAPWTTSTFPGGASPGLVERTTDPRPGAPDTPDPNTGQTTADLSPRSFYPDDPELGGRTLIRVHVPVEKGPRLARVQIRDLHAHVVRTVSRGLLVQGTHLFAWDGRGDDGSALPSGPYIVEIRITSPGDHAFLLPVAVLRR